ncbi:MAG: hypothetical protein U0U70_15240 [Chitinophagaceae bacterium]
MSPELLQPMQNEAIDPNNVYLFALRTAKEICSSYEIDENVKAAFRGLCLYFSNDTRFETEGYGKLNKGLFLSGNVGTGKTLLMTAFKMNERKPFTIVSTDKVSFNYEIDGPESLLKYSPNDMIPPLYSRAFCFDDIGSESVPTVHMGNRINVMERIILSRYEKRIPFPYTHFTTNLVDGEAIESLYGKRVRSRIREMTNLIVIPGNDRRQ